MPARRPRFGTCVAGVAAVAVVALVAVSAAVAVPPHALRQVVFAASVVLEDDRPLTVVDAATATVTVRLPDVAAQVGATSYRDVQPVAADGGTWLVDRRTGTFNLLGVDGYVVDGRGPGVGLGDATDAAAGVADGSRLYVVRGATRSTVTLVDRHVVEAAAAGRPAVPLGAAVVDGAADASRAGGWALAAGSLWLLVSAPSGSCALEQLTPVGADRPLAVARRAAVPVPCARAAVVAGSGGGVAVAAPGLVVAVPPDPHRQPSTHSLPATTTAARFVPAESRSGAEWLVATAGGWSLLRASATGETTLRGVGSLGPQSDPAPPALSAGALYTVDRASSAPSVLRIDPVTGSAVVVGPYPLVPGEAPDFARAQVLAVGPRVVVNDPAALEAVVVFTDGSHRPVTVDKRVALDVAVSGPGVPDLGRPPAGAPPAAHPSPPTAAAGAAPPPLATLATPVAVDPAATCATTSAPAYPPHVDSVTPSSTDALVTWSYHVLDDHDCVPRSWDVDVRPASGTGAPVRRHVDGQQQLLVTGLRPATAYRLDVVAELPHSTATSPPTTFTTAAQGPDAPTGVHTVADGSGHWVVSWSACDPSSCVVPADSWTVTGTACGGSYVGTPPSVTVPAGADAAVLDAAGPGLLGTSLSFAVRGETAAGLPGPSTADGTCTSAWAPPDPSRFSVGGTAVPDGATVTATVDLGVTGDPASAFGGASPQVVYSLAGRTVGPTSARSVTFAGLPPGAELTPSATVFTAGHRDAAVTLTGASFSRTVPWPALTMTAAASARPADPDTGDLTATVTGLGAGQHRADGALTCASDRLTVSGPLQPAGDGTAVLPVSGIDLTAIGGACTLTVTVTDLDTPDPYGTPSPPVSVAVQVATRPTYRFRAAYTAGCVDAACSPTVTVSLDGGGQPAAGGVDWVVTVHGPAHGCVGPSTTTSQSAAPQFPVTLPAPACADGHLDVTVAFRYLGSSEPVIDVGPPSGHPATPPTTTPPTTTPPTTTPPTTPPPTTPPTSAPPPSAPPTTAPSTTAPKGQP